MTADLSTRLLTALARSGPNPALAWYGEAARIELSGHVLANWVIKTIGHLHDEIALEPGDAVVLDLPPHWKRLVLALAAWSLGAHVTLLDEDDAEARATGTAVPTDPRLVATDRPDSALARSADEVLAVQPVSLAPRFDGQLPALVHDWVAEVRASPDQLGVVLPAWGGPAPSLSEPAIAAHDTASGNEPATGNATTPRLLVGGDGLASIPAVLAALLAGGGFVGPSAGVSERQSLDEGVTGPA